MGMFGVKDDKACDCGACVKLRQVPMSTRAGQAAGFALVVLLGVGGSLLILALIAWGLLAIGRQIIG